MTKKIMFIFFGIILSASFCFAAETVTITTYYPAPYGIYQQLRLNPTDSINPAAACANRGEMFYHNTNNSLYICNGTNWRATGIGYWLYQDPVSPANIAYVYLDETLHNPQNVHLGIGTSTPPFTLSLGDVATARDGGIFSAGIYGDAGGFSTDTWPATLVNNASYLIWSPERAAFRAGTACGTYMDAANIGGYSIGIGMCPWAGNWATAIGANAAATGTYSTALGFTVTASASNATVIGSRSSATGANSIAIGGDYVLASNTYSFVLGRGIDSASTLTNNTADSLMVGFNSTIPTLFVGPSAGAATTGNVGIATASPQQKLEVNGGVRLNTATAQPACAAGIRGTFWVTQGAAGVKDSVQVCAKDAANAYAWRTIY